jgi:16S rRNA (cytosine1402-N4)-methyltransferase
MHTPVLLKEVIQWLDPQPGRSFIDATVSSGGHALAILEKIEPGGKLLGIEWDPEIFKQWEPRAGMTAVNDNYAHIKKIAEEHDFKEVDGILFDLGISSWHIDRSGRG